MSGRSFLGSTIVLGGGGSVAIDTPHIVLHIAYNEAIMILGDGCAFRSTTYRSADYAQPSGKYGLPLHHPRFLEWIDAPESARLLATSYIYIQICISI